VTDEWVRGVALTPNDQGFFGGVELSQLPPESTLLRSWWNFNCYYTDSGQAQYPPGSSILRAGLIVTTPGLPVLSMPTPITNQDEDWLSITTLNPRFVDFELGGATSPSWHIQWGLPTDLSAKSQRRNRTEGNQGIYLTWEFLRADTPVTFRINRWNASWDLYIRTP